MADEFLDLNAVDPAAGRLKALAALGDSDEPSRLALAHRTLAVNCRDSGDIDGASSHLRAAMRFARKASDQLLIADILGTRGGTRVMLGNPRAGLRDLSVAATAAQGSLLGTILYRRAAAKLILDDPAAAAEDARTALDYLKRYQESGWIARTLQLLGECEVRLGHPKVAAAYLSDCYALLGDTSGYESKRLRMMQAWLAFLEGDLPLALETYRVDELGSVEDAGLRAEATRVLAVVFLAAGLAADAVTALKSLDPDTIPTTDAGLWRAMLARALLVVDDAAGAYDTASVAVRDLQQMGLQMGAAEAALVVAEASWLLGEDRVSAEQVAEVASDLSALGSREAVHGWLLAGRVAERTQSTSVTSDAFAQGATFRHSSDLLVAAAGWLSRARELEITEAPGVLRACSRGLDALDDYREIIGSSETRASTTDRGRELAEVCIRHAARDPRVLLRWSERWRATTLAQRPVTPHGEVSPAVAMLRNSAGLIAAAREAGEATEALERERRSLERKVRAEHHRQRAEGQSERRRFEVAELVEKVGAGAFVQLVDVDGILHVLVVSNGRVRRVIAGRTEATLELAEAGRFALRRAARTNRFTPGDFGARFQEAVLGKAARMLPDGPITISPTAALHGAPFALMPELKARPFSIVPSAAQWLRAREVPDPRTKRRTLVSGPGLLTGGAEVVRLAAEYPDATILRGADATVSNTMKAIDGAKLAHLATHGTFRADSPLFSALELADGPLSVYELERLKRAPYRTILSACDSGVLAPVGAQEVLGLASALFSLGGAGLVCSIAEVNDEATADLMMQVHASLEAKRTPAEALAAARASGGSVEQATATAFVALGV